jgi:hypothetical protein
MFQTWYHNNLPIPIHRLYLPTWSHCETVPLNMFVQAIDLFQWLLIIRGNSCWTGHADIITVRQQILNCVPSFHATNTLETLVVKLEH